MLGRQILLSEMAPHVHIFLPYENKAEKIAKWLEKWIENSLKLGKIKPLDKLPSKGDLACHIGVSLGTMQNVFRYLEDNDYLESKQRIGTYIKDKNSKSIEKLTTKRQKSVELIKKHILENGYKEGYCLASTRKLAEELNVSSATVRGGILGLIKDGIVRKENKVFVINRIDFNVQNFETKTLVEKIADKLEVYVKNNFKNGEKLPSNQVLAKEFEVSIKTVHDAIKILTNKSILKTRRGQYGTIVVNPQNSKEIYHYELVEQNLRQIILKEYRVGMKLPTIQVLSKKFKVSAKTIKKALDNLADEGYVTFERGRYGGIIVVDIPQPASKAYQWLAINSDYINNIN